MYRRHITTVFNAALQDSPVVLLIGARQVGKSTLVQSLAGEGSSAAQYLTLDDPTVLAAARGNPSGFVDGLPAPVIIDEIQRVPELLVPIKLAVDRRRAPGSFILTGSANVLTLPTVSESLAGRMEVLTLRPLSQGEISGQQETFIKRLFAGEFKLPKKPPPEERAALFARMMTGGYPEVVARQTQARRQAWFKSYITTILQRDIRDLANIEGLVDLPRLLSLLAARAGGLLNFAEVSRSIGFAQTTLKRYFALLEMTFLIETLPAWSGSRTKQLVKAPKLFLSDTGLLSYLQGLTWERLQLDPTLAGALAENFVVSELRKQATWSETRVELFHFRTNTDQEVDILVENEAGEIVGVEVKASASVGAHDFKGLHALKQTVGKKFRRGVILYTGNESVPFGDELYAMPIQAIWL